MAAWDSLAPQTITRLSSDLGLTPQQAAGIVGHLGYESEGLQAINERNPVVPGSRGGFGWAQWTGPRRQQFEAFATQAGMQPTDPEANYQFLLHELQNTPEGRVLPALRGAKDAQEAGRIFTDQFLRPGIPAHDKRQSWTERAVNFLVPAAQAGTLTEQKPMSMSERIQRARDAGFNDEEILARIQGNADMAQRIQRARDAGFSDEEIYGRMGLQGTQPATAPAAAAPEPERPGMFQQIGRQVGLTARHGIEGLGELAGMVTEPIRQGVNAGARALGLPEAAPVSSMATQAADAIGLPSPQNGAERVAGDVTRLMAGGAGIMGGAGALARGASGATGAVLQGLAANPGAQITSAAGAGAAGGAARESGAGPVVQAVAGLAGGVAAPMGLSAAQRAASGIQGRIAAAMPTQVLERVRESLAQAGVDYSALPGRVQQQLQREAAAALRSGGDLDPAALARLADFARVEGATPTRGMLTQDPGQVTREMNLAKQQANSGVTGGRNLSQIQNENNAALVRALNQMGPTDDAYAAGDRAIGALQSRLRERQGRVNDLYSAARDSAGRGVELDHRAFADRAIIALDENLAGGSLPADVRNHINRISRGEVPFTVDYAEQLKTLMGRLQRNTSDGSARYALGLVRQALDDTPPLFGGTLGDEAIGAFNQARGANRSMMKQIERTPALQDLYDGNIAPDRFVSQYITGTSVRATDAQRLGRMLAADPEARGAVRGAIVQQLKDKALSGQPDDIGAARFSPAQYAKALRQIGDRKLGAFFDADEIGQMHALSRVGRLMVNQPVGSAVNNSNTAAATIGRVLDMMGNAGRGFRLLGIGDQIQAIQSGLQQRSARQLPQALTAPAPRSTLRERAIPASVYGSLLLSAPAQGGQDQ